MKHAALFTVCAALALLAVGTPAQAQFTGQPTQTEPGRFPPGGGFGNARFPPGGGFGNGRFNPGGFNPNAQNPPAPPPEPKPSRNIVYLGGKRTAALGPLFQATLNAHVVQYQFAPKKPVAAIVGTRTVGGKVVPALWLCDTNTGALQVVPVPAAASKPGTVPAPFVLQGWDGSGRFLLVSQDVPLPVMLEGGITFETHLFRVDTQAVPMKVKRIPTPVVVALPFRNTEDAFWPPLRRRVLFHVYAGYVPPTSGGSYCLLYNVMQDKMRLFRLPAGLLVLGWDDEATVRLLNGNRLPRSQILYDVQTGREHPAPRPVSLPETVPLNLCPSVKGLTVSSLGDQSFQGGGAVFGSAQFLWLTMEGKGFPLTWAFVDVVPGPDDPQIAWAADGSRFGFVAHGDLFMQPITFQDATLEERANGGDTLTDDEQETLATQTVMRVRAALNELTHGGITALPSAEDFNISVLQRFSPDVAVSFSSFSFVYHAPPLYASPQDSNMANFVLGEFPLPRATITLYGDGQIVSVPRPASRGFGSTHPQGSTGF